MFGLGVLGIFQVLFFPGLIIKKFITLPKNFLIGISSIVGLSLITNYVFAFFLTAACQD